MGILQILELTESSFKINTAGFNSILEKVGDLPIVLISMNGSSREGKSYALNYFIRYFKSQGSDDWFNTELRPEEMFSFKSGRERETIGMNVYTEPFVVTTAAGKQLAVLLLDCQGLFDDKTTFKQNAVIFALSNLFSSALIYNVKSKIEENLLQNVQFFSNYAQAIVDQQGTEDLLPPLTFLIRDFAFDYEYPLGYHSSTECPPEGVEDAQNYFDATFSMSEEMPLENKIVRKEILTKFQDVGMFLLPFPGKAFLMDSVNNEPDQDFQYYLHQFVTLMTSERFLTPKAFDGKELTGRKLQYKVMEWAALCEESASKFPEAQTLAESHSIMRNEMALSNAVNVFTERLDQAFKASPEGFTEDELLHIFEKFRQEGAQAYQNARRNEAPDVVGSCLQKFQETCEELFENYYFGRNKDILARKQLQANQMNTARRQEEVIEKLREEISILQDTSDDPEVDKTDGGSSIRGSTVPIKPKRKAPPRPAQAPKMEISMDSGSSAPPGVQTGEAELSTSVVVFPEKQDDARQNTALARNILSSNTDGSRELVVRSSSPSEAESKHKKKSALSGVKNFFTRFFVKGPQKLNRNFQSMFIKRKQIK